MNYVVCWTKDDGERLWSPIEGEEALEEKLQELSSEGVDELQIMVFRGQDDMSLHSDP